MNKQVKIFVSAFDPVQAASDLESQINSFLQATTNIQVIDLLYQVNSTGSSALLLYAITN